MVEGIKVMRLALSSVGMGWLVAPFPVTLIQGDNRNFLELIRELVLMKNKG
jgi:hypothetical protein